MTIRPRSRISLEEFSIQDHRRLSRMGTRRRIISSNREMLSRVGIPHFERLPVELKVTIFFWCLASYPRFRSREAPLLLSQVCSSWRSLVCSTPKLWASFQVDVPDLGDLDPVWGQKHMAAINVWLTRSKSYPLSVRLTHNPLGSIPDDRSARLLAALIPHVHRWKNIDLRIPSSSLIPLQDSMPGEFLALKSVTFDMRGRWSASIPFDVRSLGIPWGQLAELHLNLDYSHLLSLDECLAILTHCARLSRCTLNADCSLTLLNGRASKIVLPMLKHLRLILQSGEQRFHNGVRATEIAEFALVFFLEQLEFTQLQTLNLEWLVKLDDDNNEGRWSEIRPRFISVLSRLNPTLVSLAFAYLPLTEADLLDCFVQLPKITHLDLRFSLANKERDPVSDNFLRSIILRPGDSLHGFLPLLETVYLQCSGARCTARAIVEFILSRWSPVAQQENTSTCLTCFRFISMKPVPSDLQELVSSWSGGGLDVSIDQVVVR